jgi:hypothetical protein
MRQSLTKLYAHLIFSSPGVLPQATVSMAVGQRPHVILE